MSKLRYILYARKSTEAKERQALSIPEQISECRKCIETLGLTVVKELQESKSAFKTNNRPAFDTMLAMIKRNEADAILTWKPDRLCRNPKEGGELLQLLQNDVIKEIRTPLGDSYTPESDQIILLIHFGMANQYSRNISQNVRRSLPNKVGRGEYFREAPLGYENFGKVKGHRNIQPNAFEAPIMKGAFEMASIGCFSLKYIAEELFGKGLRTKKGKPISKSHLYQMLSNPIYYGYFYFKGELYKGSYTPIISKDLYDKVQIALGNRSKPKINSWKSPYNCLIKCSYCGCSITTTVKRKYNKGTDRTAIYTYHNCTKRHGFCPQKPVMTSKLEEMLVNVVSGVSIDKDVWSLGMELVKSKYSSQVKQHNTQLEHHREVYNTLQDRLNRLIIMRADDEITPEEFKEQRNLIMEERSKVEDKINDTKYSSDNWLERTEEFLDTAYYAKEVIQGEDIEKKRKLITTLCCDLTLKDGNLDVTYRKPFDVLLNPAYSTSWLGDRDSNPNTWDQNP